MSLDKQTYYWAFRFPRFFPRTIFHANICFSALVWRKNSFFFIFFRQSFPTVKTCSVMCKTKNDSNIIQRNSEFPHVESQIGTIYLHSFSCCRWIFGYWMLQRAARGCVTKKFFFSQTHKKKKKLFNEWIIVRNYTKFYSHSWNHRRATALNLLFVWRHASKTFSLLYVFSFVLSEISDNREKRWRWWRVHLLHYHGEDDFPTHSMSGRRKVCIWPFG